MASNGHRFHEEYDASYESTAMAIASQIMVAAVVILFTAVLFILGLHIYAHYFCRRSRLSFRGRRLVFVSEQDPPRLQSIGLAKSAIEALPVFVYQTENHKDGLECAVCLCEFVENENARLLPKCRHSFHIDCIDMWFFSHSTCPLCRASAQPDTPADSVVVQVVDEQAASGSASETDQQPVLLRPISVGNASTSMEPDLDIEIDLCHSCRHQEVLPSPTYPTGMLFWATQKRVSSESNTDVFDQETTSSSCKTLEQISIEIPRRVDSFSSPKLFSSDDQQPFSPSGQTLKSPGIRLRSLKRLLSKDMKVVPQSPDAGRNIHIEQEGLLIVES